MTGGNLSARVKRLEGTEVGECPVCHGRCGAIGIYTEGEDGICRDQERQPMPTGDPGRTCAGCGRYYPHRAIVYRVIGRSKSLGHTEYSDRLSTRTGRVDPSLLGA